MTEDTGLARKRRKPNSIYYNNNYCKMVEPMHKEGCGYSAAVTVQAHLKIDKNNPNKN